MELNEEIWNVWTWHFNISDDNIQFAQKNSATARPVTTGGEAPPRKLFSPWQNVLDIV